MRYVLGAVFLSLMGGVAEASPLTPDQQARMAAADVVVLGEIHDNALHHEGQAALVAHLAPRAVVFEMLTPKMAEIANDVPRDARAGMGAAVGWAEAGWPDFAIYLPIFEALEGARIVGAAAPRAQVRTAFTEGAAAVFGAGAQAFALDQPLPQAEQALRAQMQFSAHCEAMPLEMMGGMIEAQRLRDAQFAQATLQALETYGAPVVVITGNGHARRDWGVPYMMAVAAPEVVSFSVGFVEGRGGTEDPRFDATVATKGAARGDPCAAFD